MIKESVHYCYKENEEYKYFSNNVLATQMHGVNKTDIIQVKVRENINNVESNYWGYWEHKENRFLFVFPSELQLRVCSPNFFKSNIERKEGLVLNVIIDENI